MPEPSILWQTSPDRTQALWAWDKLYSPQRAEHFSRVLSYRHGADKGGWSCTKLLRLPGTYNHKPTYKRPEVKLLKSDWSHLRNRPSLDDIPVPVWGTSEISIESKTAPQEHRALLKQFRRDLHPRVRAFLSDKKAYEQDRSKAIYEMIADLHRVGAKPHEIATLVGQSAYFISKHGTDTNKLASEINRVISKQGGHRE